jgi:abequosyltransferase
MKPPPILTIVIPTFNRVNSLSLLLNILTSELRGYEDTVNVVVGDNASSDTTPLVTAAFKIAYSNAKILRHPVNLGPDENFCRCVDQVKTRYFWIFGDDDLPRIGVLPLIIQLLLREDIDILHMHSKWCPNVALAIDAKPIQKLTIKLLSREVFARDVNVWTTFISGMVVNLDSLHELNQGLDIRRFAGTNLVQLGWILPLLMSSNRFRVIVEQCVLATSGNTGGYKLLTVFGTNFPEILDEVCGASSAERNSILKALAWNYMPSLVWNSRFRSTENFLIENRKRALAPLASGFAYWIVIWPVAFLPKFFAFPVWFLNQMRKKLMEIVMRSKSCEDKTVTLTVNQYQSERCNLGE